MNFLFAIFFTMFASILPTDKQHNFENPPLPYAYDALEPVITEKTMRLHHGKHQQGYVNNLNKLKKGTPYENMTIEEIVMKSDGGLFNNAAQAYNHAFFFDGLREACDKPMPKSLQKKIEKSFGSVEAFQKEMTSKGATLFGSGWVWLVMTPGEELEIVTTSNAANPMLDGNMPILVFDVWEHAYYLDYQNLRANYLEAIWDLVDWDKVNQRVQQAKK